MKVIVPVVNNPTFVRLQALLLKKFMPCDYEFIVFNDAKAFPDYSNFNNPTLRQDITQTCHSLGITCILLDNHHHQFYNVGASTRHTDTLRIMKQYMMEHPDSYLMIDSDMFPISTIPIQKYASYSSGAIVSQQRGEKEYMWPNLFYFDTRIISDFEQINWDLSPGCDTGGMSQEWLKKQKRDNVFFIQHLCSLGWGFVQLPDKFHQTELVNFLQQDLRNQDNKYWCEIYDECLLHYRAGSNWNGEGKEIHETMTKNLESVLLSLL